MRIQIYFVRHAESESNRDPLFKGDAGLTEVGLKQAQAVALKLKQITVEAIYTSKIRRALLTADEIQKVIGIKPVILEFLKERKGSYSEDLKFTPSETFEELKKRILEAKTFLEHVSEKHIVVVSHAIFLKSFAAYLMLGESLTEELLQKIDGGLVLENTGVSKIVYNTDKKEWKIMMWNDCEHLNR